MAKTKIPKKVSTIFFKIFISDFCTRFGFMNLFAHKNNMTILRQFYATNHKKLVFNSIYISPFLFRLTPLWITTNNFRQINVTKGIIKIGNFTDNAF